MPFVLVILLAIVVLVLAGTIILGLALKLLWWAIIGLVIGGIARAVIPGRQPIGVAHTALDGIAGSLLGGVIANAANLGGFLQFIVAVLVAAVLVVVTARHQAREGKARRGLARR